MDDTDTWHLHAAMKCTPRTESAAYELRDHFAIGAFVITIGCRLLYVNSAAHRLLLNGGGLTAVRVRVHIKGPRAARAFRDAVARSNRNASTEHEVIHQARPSDQPALILCLASLKEHVVVDVIDAARAPEVNPEMRQVAHRLSKAESRVVASPVRTADLHGGVAVSFSSETKNYRKQAM